MHLVWLWCVLASVGGAAATAMLCPQPSPGGAGRWSVRVAIPHQPRPSELKVRIVPTPQRVETSIGQMTLQKINRDHLAVIPGNVTLAPDTYIFITYKDQQTKPLLKYMDINNVRLCYSESMDAHTRASVESDINNVVGGFLQQEANQAISQMSSDVITTEKNYVSSSMKPSSVSVPISNMTSNTTLPEKMKNGVILNTEKPNKKPDSNLNSDKIPTQYTNGNDSVIKYTLHQNITNDIVANVSNIVMDRVVKMLHNNMKSCCKGMKNAMSASNTTKGNTTNTIKPEKKMSTNGTLPYSMSTVIKFPSTTSKPTTKYTNTTHTPRNKLNPPTAVILKHSIENGTVATGSHFDVTSNANHNFLQLPKSDIFSSKRVVVNHKQAINITTEAPKHIEQHSNTSQSGIQYVNNGKDANTTRDTVGNISADLTTYIKQNDDKKKLENNVTKSNDGYLVLNLKLVKPLINVEKENEAQVYKKIKEMESDLERLDKEIMLRYVESEPDQDSIRKMEKDMDKFFSVSNLRKALHEDTQFETPTTEDYFTSLETTMPSTYYNMLR